MREIGGKSVVATAADEQTFSRMFLNSPPTFAAKWITCVGWCLEKTARVSSRLLRGGGMATPETQAQQEAQASASARAE